MREKYESLAVADLREIARSRGIEGSAGEEEEEENCTIQHWTEVW